AAIRAAGLTERHPRAMLRLPHRHAVLAAVEAAARGRMSVSETERFVEAMLSAPAAPEEPAPARERRLILRDARVLVNSIRSVVDTANASGIPARMERRETGDSIILSVILPKERRAPPP
ncbi:MAG: hypothetical protein IJL69_02145, partial [Oscillospiraceae bacterium]|nr:hypothetical protein [Oscillospiraceae bacterium]